MEGIKDERTRRLADIVRVIDKVKARDVCRKVYYEIYTLKVDRGIEDIDERLLLCGQSRGLEYIQIAKDCGDINKSFSMYVIWEYEGNRTEKIEFNPFCPNPSIERFVYTFNVIKCFEEYL